METMIMKENLTTESAQSCKQLPEGAGRKPEPGCAEDSAGAGKTDFRSGTVSERRPMERIYLNAEEISTKEKMAGYMKEAFRFPDYFGGNLDALNDLLSEVYEDTQICLTRSNLEKICGNSYAYRTLTVLGAAAAENPHLAILFVQ